MIKKKINIVATLKPWNIIFFKKAIKKLSGKWMLIDKQSKLNIKNLSKYKIDNIYFIHWSNIIKKNIFNNYNCISFHMTDLPYGRGGSPLQNLILSKKKNTKITAFKMNDKIDGGPIYLKENLELKGSAQKIFNNAKNITYRMIKRIHKKKINPKNQKKGKIIFKRLSKRDNELNFKKIKSLNELYDRIRMVDAPTYPNAFIKISNFSFEFYNVKKNINEIRCIAKIKNEK